MADQPTDEKPPAGTAGDEFVEAIRKLQQLADRRAARLSFMNYVALVVAVGGLVVAIISSAAAAQSTDAQVKAFKMQWRPWLAVKNFIAPAPTIGIPKGQAVWELTNVGAVPALNVRTAAHVMLLFGPPTYAEAFPDKPKVFGTIGSNQVRETLGGFSVEPEAGTVVTGGTKTAYACAVAEYDDMDEKTHAVRSCFRYELTQQMWIEIEPPSPPSPDSL